MVSTIPISIVTVTTVGSLAQSNKYANWMRHYLPVRLLKEDETILPEPVIRKERKSRYFLYIANQVAAFLPCLIWSPGTLIYSTLGSAVVAVLVGYGKESCFPSNKPVDQNVREKMECTAVLNDTAAKVEKTFEGTIALSNGIASSIHGADTAIFNGVWVGAALGYHVGRGAAQRMALRPTNPQIQPSPSTLESGSYVPPVIALDELVPLHQT